MMTMIMHKHSKKTRYLAKIPDNSLFEPLTRNHSIYTPHIISSSTTISSACKMDQQSHRIFDCNKLNYVRHEFRSNGCRFDFDIR